MSLPEELEQKIQSLCEGLSEKDLSRAAEDLSTRYQELKSHQTDIHRLVYLCVRMPATYAVLCRIFQEFEVPQTVIDCGAGPGTSLWALPNHSITLIEHDPAFVKLGKELAPHANSTWKTQIFFQYGERAEMILFSFSLNEIHPSKLSDTISYAHEQTDNFIVVVEPGTPEGFERVRKVRSQLLELGMSLHAPCPHHNACPMGGGRTGATFLFASLEHLSTVKSKRGVWGLKMRSFHILSLRRNRMNLVGHEFCATPSKRRGTYFLISAQVRG